MGSQGGEGAHAWSGRPATVYPAPLLAGALTTGLVLAGGLFAFRAGNSQLSQTMMRLRVLAQASPACPRQAPSAARAGGQAG